MRWIAAAVMLASAVAHADPTGAPPPAGPDATPVPTAPPPRTASPTAVPMPDPQRPQSDIKVDLGFGFGAVGSTPDQIVPACEAGGCGTPLGVTADVFIGKNILPNVALGGRFQGLSQVLLEGGSSTQLHELGFFGSVELGLGSRVTLIGAAGLATAWFKWKESRLIVDETETESIGFGPMALGGVRVTVNRGKRGSWGIEGRASIAHVDQTLPGVHLLATYFN